MRVAVPEWVKVLPAGEFVGRDGRGPFKNAHPAKIIANTKLLGLEELTLDFDHATDFAPNSAAAPAGWWKELQIRDGAIFARIDWTDHGREAVAAKEYRYISPVFKWDETTGEVLQLLRAGLTNSPNLYGTAICERQKLAISVAMPVVAQQEGIMLSEAEKAICRNMGVRQAEFATFSARGSEPFSPSRERNPDEGLDRELEAPKGEYDGRRGGRRAEEAPRGRIEVPEGEKPARLDGRDGEGHELEDAQLHQLAHPDHDDDQAIEAGICQGERCEVDHIAKAHELIRQHLSMRESLPSSHGMVRFQR